MDCLFVFQSEMSVIIKQKELLPGHWLFFFFFYFISHEYDIPKRKIEFKSALLTKHETLTPNPTSEINIISAKHLIKMKPLNSRGPGAW